MIDNAVVQFTNGSSIAAERVKFCDAGMVGIRSEDGWLYYPREHIGRIAAPTTNDD